MDERLDQVTQMGRGVDQLEHRRRRDAEEAELQEEAARLDASVDERAEDQLRVLDPVEEVLPHRRAVEVTEEQVQD